MAAKTGHPGASRDASSEARLFKGIRQLVTLSAAARKGARRIQSEDLSIIESAAFAVRDGAIAWVGRESEIPNAWLGVETTDLRGAVVLPAFVECHTHMIFAGQRAGEFERRLRGESYQSIGKSGGGILSTVRAVRAASEDDLVREGQARLSRFMRQGVGTVEVKSGYGLDADNEMKMLRAAGRLKGARIVRTFLGAHAVPEGSTAAAYLTQLQALLPNMKELADRVDIFIENGYFSVEMARPYLTRARELGFDLAVHAEQLSHSGGAQLAVELGARSSEHLIQINEADIAALAKSEVTCVLLPTSDLYMQCAYPPARQLIDQGARVAIATDFNPGSAPSQDLAAGGLLARLMMKMTWPEVLVAYTLGGAHALGLANEIGSIEVGKRADFISLDGELESLFYEIGRQPVRALFRDGHKIEVQAEFVS